MLLNSMINSENKTDLNCLQIMPSRFATDFLHETNAVF